MSEDGESTNELGSLLQAIAATPSRTPGAAPERIAQFRVLARLGAGGMGVVYRAEDETLRRPVALKVLPDSVAGDAARRERLFREARSAAAVNHSNVAVVYSVGEEAGRVFIAMELVEGESLRERLQKGPIDVAVARDLASQIALGLEAAHAKGLMHRDLKPENVMITPEGGVKLLDFGLAKALAETGPGDGVATDEEHLLSDQGQVLGTPDYMSPEQAMGEPLNLRSDVFSFGVVLYEMLTGARPFRGKSLPALLTAIARDEPAPLRARAPLVDEATEAVVTRCLAKSPEDRFADAGELVAALSTLASAALRPMAASVVARPPKKDRWRFAGAIGVAALALASGGLAVQRAVAEGSSAAIRQTPPLGPSTQPAVTAAPASAVPLARVELERGIDAALHEGPSIALPHLEAALAADPTCALAEAWLAEVHLKPTARTSLSSVDAGRRHFANVRTHLARLGPREQAILLAHEPLTHATPDYAAFGQRMRALALEHPEDAQIALLVYTAEVAAGHVAEARAAAARVVANDPAIGEARAALCKDLEAKDKQAELACYRRCLEASPGAGDCHLGRFWLLNFLGKCDELEPAAREWEAQMPESHLGARYLAQALTVRGRPLEAVLEAFARARTHASSTAYVEFEEAEARAAHGDFEGAITAARVLMKRPETRPPGKLWLGSLIGGWLEESGRPREALAEIDTLLRAAPAWNLEEPDSVNNAPAILAALKLSAAKLALTLGRATIADLVATRAASAAELDRYDLAPYALTYTTSPDDAAQLLRSIRVPDPKTMWLTRVGIARLAAGDVAGAVTALQDGLAECGLGRPFEILYARAALGEALEKAGEIEGARREYDLVLAAWGDAKPRSVTAERARARRGKLPVSMK